LVNNQNEQPSLMKQTGKPGGNWVLLKLEGVKSNRSAIGARVRLTAGGLTQTDEVRSGGSYLSQNDLRLHFGVGTARRINRIEIDWPSGGHQVETELEVNRVVTIREKPGA
jgi:enediyne biosynthesis protein E4